VSGLTITISSHEQTKICNAEFEALTEVVKKDSIFWDVTPCSPLTTKENAALYPIGQNISKYFLMISYIQLDHPVHGRHKHRDPVLQVGGCTQS
jgi:hypothetical protein